MWRIVVRTYYFSNGNPDYDSIVVCWRGKDDKELREFLDSKYDETLGYDIVKTPDSMTIRYPEGIGLHIRFFLCDCV